MNEHGRTHMKQFTLSPLPRAEEVSLAIKERPTPNIPEYHVYYDIAGRYAAIHLWNVGIVAVVKQPFIYTERVLSIEQISDLELFPCSQEAIEHVFIPYYMQYYAPVTRNIWKLEDPASNDGCIIHTNLHCEGKWQITMYNHEGKNGQVIVETKEDGLKYAIAQHCIHPVPALKSKRN